MDFKKKVPNLVTGGRIVLFWIMMYLIAYTSGKFELAHVLFYFFGMIVYMLDSLDGYLARRFNATSEFGSQFDQCGDKLVAFSMILYIVSLKIYPAKVLIVLIVMTAIILFRDILLNAFRLVSSRFQLVFETSKIGKFRAFVIGFGGGLEYMWFYWGNNHSWVQKTIWILLSVNAVLFLMFFVFRIGGFLLRFYPKTPERLCIVSTLVVSAIYPPYTIPLCLCIITMYTFIDYWWYLHKSAKATKPPEIVKKIRLHVTLHTMSATIFTILVLVAVHFSAFGGIVLASAIFLFQLVWSAILMEIQAKQKETSSVAHPLLQEKT